MHTVMCGDAVATVHVLAAIKLSSGHSLLLCVCVAAADECVHDKPTAKQIAIAKSVQTNSQHQKQNDADSGAKEKNQRNKHTK